jgi:hypothetical protein
MTSVFKDLEDAMAIMARIENVQTKNLPDLREFQQRTRRNLVEITDKLNRLIGYEGPKN